MVIYLSHVVACIWIWIGFHDNCKDKNGKLIPGCIQSWIYKNNFESMSIESKYVFSFYWIFEVITTVGYGDYSGATKMEFVFSIILEFLGLTLFSFLIGSITSFFESNDSFESL